MTISLIAAIGKNYELGKNNDLVWHFHADMKFFRQTTSGSTVVMGRKTFESLPKALPNRRNIVITSNTDKTFEGAKSCKSIDEALKMCENEENVFIIGGGRVYSEFLDLADKLYLTEIDATDDETTVYFPHFDKSLFKKEVLQENEEDGIKFNHVLYTKIK